VVASWFVTIARITLNSKPSVILLGVKRAKAKKSFDAGDCAFSATMSS
jgi:hypothetical protein